MIVRNLDTVFAALSDPTRRAIVDRLKQGPATVNELAGPFAMTQQAISKHLAYLEQARVITKKRHGRLQICSLRPQAIREVAVWANNYQQFWTQSLERLDTLLERQAK